MIQRNIFLLLGSNSGDRPGQLRRAMDAIENELGNIMARSRVYETAPWGKADQPDFLNQVLQIESLLSPAELLSKVLGIERALGRTRQEKWGERLIDIDILYFGDKTIDTGDLIVPHPHIAARRFVLVPLVEISPGFIHPLLQKSNLELLKECPDILPVKEFKG